jgi:hypothetical protein
MQVGDAGAADVRVDAVVDLPCGGSVSLRSTRASRSTAAETSAIWRSPLGEIMKPMWTQSPSARVARFWTTNPWRRTKPSNLRSRPGCGWPVMRM